MGLWQKNIIVQHNKGTEAELEIARGINDEYNKTKVMPKDSAMPGTMARRIISLSTLPDEKELNLTGVGVGGLAFMGVTGEPFTEVGRRIKNGSPFTVTIPCCCANGYEGYYPTSDAYEEGGYEACCAKFRAGTAEQIADSSIALAKELYMSLQ